MKGSKLTPSPWRLSRVDKYWVLGSDNIAICNLRHRDGNPRKNAEANARLIAAAPEIYESLKAVAEWEDCGNYMPESLIKKFKKALFKVDGNHSK